MEFELEQEKMLAKTPKQNLKKTELLKLDYFSSYFYNIS